MTKPIDWTKPVQTRDGREVWLRRNEDGSVWLKDASYVYRIMGGIVGVDSVVHWDSTGSCPTEIPSCCLINVPKPVEFVLNVYVGGVVSYSCVDKADKGASNERTDTLRLHNTGGTWQVEEVE